MNILPRHIDTRDYDYDYGAMARWRDGDGA
jgi:hypothetical protein